MKFQTNYKKRSNYGIKFEDESRTQQQFKDESNPYVVLDKYTRGLPVRLNTQTPQYLDVSNVNPLSHSGNIEEIKKSLASQEEKLEKLQKEENEKIENERFEKHEKRRNAKPENKENLDKKE